MLSKALARTFSGLHRLRDAARAPLARNDPGPYHVWCFSSVVLLFALAFLPKAVTESAVAPPAAESAMPAPCPTGLPPSFSDAIGGCPDILPVPTLTPAPRPGKLAGLVIGLDPGHTQEWDPGGTGFTANGREAFSEGIPLYEQMLTLLVAYKMKPLLEQEGATVCVTRTPEGDLQLAPYDYTGDGLVRPNYIAPEDIAEVTQPRIDWLNQCGANIVVSIHFNGFEDRNFRGSEVYFSDLPPDGPENFRFGRTVLDALLEALAATGYPSVDRGVQPDNYDGHDPAAFRRVVGHYGFDSSCANCKRLLILGDNPMSKNRLEARDRILVEAEFLSSPLFVDYAVQPGFFDNIAAGLVEGIKRFVASTAS